MKERKPSRNSLSIERVPEDLVYEIQVEASKARLNVRGYIIRLLQDRKFIFDAWERTGTSPFLGGGTDQHGQGKRGEGT